MLEVLLQSANNGALHREEMSVDLNVLADDVFLPGGDSGRLCNQLHGSCRRQFPHAE